jgi:4-hydroxybenzoate polyprenyltransferase
MAVDVEADQTHRENPSGIFRRISPTELRLFLLVLMGAFFASAATIPSMGILLRQMTHLLLP